MIKNSHTIIKVTSAALLLFFSIHSLSVHGFADSLIYCFESNGDINIESTSSLSFGIASDCDLHADIIFSDTDAEFHSDSDYCIECNDLELDETCAKDNRVNRFDQDKSIEKINNDLYQLVSILPNSAKKQLSEFIPPIIEHQELASLRTVVLLN